MSTSTETKPTPGPWVIEDENDIYGAGGELIASAYPMKRDASHDSWKANARLIAAAPELLEALELAFREMEEFEKHERRSVFTDTKERIGAVIRKGRGEQREESVAGKSVDQIISDGYKTAALIAAAPEMLEALEFVEEFFSKLERDMDWGDPLQQLREKYHAPIHNKLRPLISKARGTK